MKLTRMQLRKLIREMYSPNFEFMGMMSDIGSPMVKQLATYLIPYQDRVRFEIEDSSSTVDVKMFLDDVEIGYIGADFMADMCSNCYMVGMSSTAAGEERNDNNLYGFRLDLIKDDLFKVGENAFFEGIANIQKSSKGMDLQSFNTSTLSTNSDDKIFSENIRKAGDVKKGGAGTSKTVGGTGKYAGITGECEYTVNYLPKNKASTIFECSYTK